VTRGLPWEGGSSATARGALLFGAVVVVTGVRFVGLPFLVSLHADPLRLLERQDQWFLHGSILNIFVGHALHVVEPLQIQGFYLVASLLAMAALLYYGHRALPDEGPRWTFFLLVALSPVLHVLVFWIGKADPFIVAAYAFLLLTRNPVAAGGLSLAITLSHQEIATILLAVHVALHRPRPATLVGLIAGWAIGLGLHQVYATQIGLAGSFRVGWLWDRPGALARMNFARPLTMAAFSFCWFWAAVLVFLHERRERLIMGLAALCFGVAALALDFTRVFTLMALPLIVYIARELAREEGGALRPWRRSLVLLAFMQMELAQGRVWDNGWALMLVRAVVRWVQGS
jgi:hypothetical protein